MEPKPTCCLHLFFGFVLFHPYANNTLLQKKEHVCSKRKVKAFSSRDGEEWLESPRVEIGGGTLSEIYQSAKKLLLRTRDGLEKLERLENAGGIDSPDLSTSVKRDISQIQSLCSEMDRLWRSVGAKSQRDLWKRKVEQIAEEAQSLKESLDKYNLRNQKRAQEARERSELLGRANGEGAHVLRIFDDEAQARASVHSSSRMLEEASATGESILRKYAEQRDWLKSAQRKGLDVLNTMGLSNSVLKLIERRNRVDQSIKYAGMVLTVVIVVYLIWRWR
ncbi:membrin-11 [Prunus persica]|uniref:membrin-11 n=1 Tax=Prunus persica TaxID=3760 RepID=UPI0009AB3146|nr:membrin-11 [Prunus persica]